MSTGVLLAVLAAALMHASWNAIIRGAPDKRQYTILLHACAALLAAVGLCFTGLPSLASAPYIATSAVIHWVYIALLMRIYEGGQLAVGYVAMRGLAPLLVFLFSVGVLHEALPLTAWLGVASILGGVLTIALFSGQPLALLLRHPSGRAALLNAGLIASYTLVDGQGVRLSGNPLGYVFTLVLLDPLLALTQQWRRDPQVLMRYAREHWKLGFIGAGISTAGYGIVLWAMTQAPVALVAALRESSVVFAVLIGGLWFKEGRLRPGLLAAGMVLGGVALIRL
ncbi:EamA family transporter [Hydrogenophaga sp.]|uniref:EamA family transporter n=1 Tax=Hydrogenophaga sp. TaxID=1904254 RepID=UPI0025C163FB|nr:EamA family transporter [Hydrogenophaga sp.]